MTCRRAKLHEDTNFRLMRILQADSDLSQREMGKALGISFGGINYCLNALVAKGLVKIEIVTFKSEIKTKNGEKPHLQ